MNNFVTYLSSAPVVLLLTVSLLSGLLIEINRFYPDPLILSEVIKGVTKFFRYPFKLERI